MSPARDLPRSFAELPGGSFVISTLPVVEDAADLSLGMQLNVSERVNLSLSYDGRLAGQITQSHGSIGLRLKM